MKTSRSIGVRRIRSVFLLGLSLCMLAALSGQTCQPSTPPPQEGVTDVTIQNSIFSPNEVTISAGESVRWTNRDFALHTATSGNPGDPDAGSVFETGNLSRGQSSTIQFDQVGEFIYFCRLHPTTMFGAKVIVTE